MFYLFASNAIVTYAITILYEKNKQDSLNFVIPKNNGAVTSLGYIGCFLAFKPQALIGPVPYYLLPSFFLFYELYQLKN